MKKIYVVALIVVASMAKQAKGQYTKLVDFAGATNGSIPIDDLVQASDGMLYGTTNQGGASSMGVLFQYNPTTSTILTKLDFAGTGATIDGSYPNSSLMQGSDGMLYGMTANGGASDNGVLFQYNPATNVYTKELDFAGTTNGNNPAGDLMQASDGMLYGMTNLGGASTNCGTNGCGVLFQYNPATSTYTKKLDFDSTNGSTPYGSLMQASDGMLYGMTSGGGANNYGVLFQYNPATNTLTKKIDFAGAANGDSPSGSLMQATDGMLYGMTSIGGANNNGVIFQYNPATSTYIKKLDFAGATNGRNPLGSLMQASDGMLYGMTYSGGANDSGVVFQWNPATNTYTKKLDFAGITNGNRPYRSLMQASDGMLYGMTQYGGASNLGVLFKYDIGATVGIQQIANSNEVTIYPNPAKDVLNVECLMVNEKTEITINDILGNTIYHSTLNTQHKIISVSDLAEGVYNISINSPFEGGKGDVNKRLVIVR